MHYVNGWYDRDARLRRHYRDDCGDTKNITADGFLTAYALACGYKEIILNEWRDGVIKIEKEGGQDYYTVYSSIGVYAVTKYFLCLKKAREYIQSLMEMKG